MTHLQPSVWTDADDEIGFAVYMASNGISVTVEVNANRYSTSAPRPSNSLAVACSLAVIIATLSGLAYGIIRSIRW